jgi:hypothetical protein
MHARCVKCNVIQGDIEAPTRLDLSGACLSITVENMFFHAHHILFGSSWVFAVPTLHTNMITKFSTIKIFKIPVANCAVIAIDHDKHIPGYDH